MFNRKTFKIMIQGVHPFSGKDILDKTGYFLKWKYTQFRISISIILYFFDNEDNLLADYILCVDI